MRNKEYRVRAWFDGHDYDADKPADWEEVIKTSSETKAEDIGDKRSREKLGTCDVIVAVLEEESPPIASNDIPKLRPVRKRT